MAEVRGGDNSEWLLVKCGVARSVHAHNGWVIEPQCVCGKSVNLPSNASRHGVAISFECSLCSFLDDCPALHPRLPEPRESQEPSIVPRTKGCLQIFNSFDTSCVRRY